MEKELNIAAILKDKPKGTKLWSPICGECKLHLIKMSNPEPIEVAHGNNGGIITLSKDGKYFLKGESILFPSKEMRSWEKFAWKKGDVLVNNQFDYKVFFDKWGNDTYTWFYGKSEHFGNAHYDTANYALVSEEVANSFIKNVEEHYGGKLNLSTLQIEQPKQEFKDGDILTIEDNGYKATIIYKCKDECSFRCYAKIDDVYKQLGIDIRVNTLGRHVHLATDSEKQQLFDALAKEGKVWNSETKQIEDLSKKCEFKPMDWCLMKYKGHYNNRGWELCQYAYTEHRASYFDNKSKDFYHAVGGEIYAECIPYNDSTKHLLGTTDEWKGGEG